MKPISPQNYALLEANVDELVSIMNAIMKAKNLPFTLMQFRVVEVDSPSDEKMMEAWRTQEPFTNNPEMTFKEFADLSGDIREQFTNLNRDGCPNGVLDYKCDPITGVCVPICR